jgi:hypothetical protein
VGYCEDFVDTARIISLAHSGKVDVIPPPISYYAGAYCPLSIRTSAEVNNWSKAVFKDDDWFLTSSFGLASAIISDNNNCPKPKDYVITLKLPASMEANSS